VQEYRERFNYGDLRPGRKYVLHVAGKNARDEFINEDMMSIAIRRHLAEDPDARITVIQMPAGPVLQPQD
jgi:hypothetical protein